MSITPLAYESLQVAAAATGPKASVVADDPITSRRVTTALTGGGVPVVAVSDDADDLPGPVEELRPDVLVLALDLSRSAHLTSVRRLRKDAGDAAIVVVGRGPTLSCAREALNAGADAFVLETDVEAILSSVVRAAVAGQVSVPRSLRRCIVRPAFSHRERQVLAMVVEGLQNREIADRLFLAESTVKSHLGSSFEKLGVRSRKEAAALVLDPAEGLRALVFGTHPDLIPSTEEA